MKEIKKLEDLPIYALEMLTVAKNARSKAYAPISKYTVGAAVIDENDNVHGGCNVENCILVVDHAEGSAITNMILNGGTRIKAVLCITEDGGASCGLCRQLIWEHCHDNKEVPIFLLDKNSQGMVCTIGELLPFAFNLKSQT